MANKYKNFSAVNKGKAETETPKNGSRKKVTSFQGRGFTNRQKKRLKRI